LIGSKISRRYAKALLSIGQEDGQYEKYGGNLQDFSVFCSANPEFLQVLATKLFPLEDRKKVLDAALGKSDYSDLVRNFLRLLLDKNRIGAIREISDYYAELTDEISNITRASIVTARPLKEDSLERLKGALAKLTAKQVKTEVQEDESLIGGLVVKIGDMVLDGSVKAQLEGLKESLKRGEYS
jgi:F-type H+-transporting ATPase subunit delta